MALAPRAFPQPWQDGMKASRSLPSGQTVELFEVLVDQVGLESWLRFRFLAPEIGKTETDLTFAQTQSDFEVLCAEVALPYMAEFDLTADVVVVALLDRPVEFGVADPEATQFIETFRVDGGQCEAEGLW
jgi:hypothetical protein